MGNLPVWDKALAFGQVNGFNSAVVFLENNNISIESSSDLFNLGVIAISLSEY